MSNNNCQADLSWIVLLGLIFLLGTGRSGADQSGEVIIT